MPFCKIRLLPYHYSRQDKLPVKYLSVILPLLIALISLFVLSGPASSPEFHADSLAALEEKQTTVLELSAASAAASAAITLIPGDTATPSRTSWPI